jgi:hypothetical protein
MKSASIVAGLAVLACAQFFTAPPALADRDLAFEQKSMQWMKQTREIDEAVKANRLEVAERILKTVISDRINYNLDLSSERGQLAHIYESMGKNDQAEALYKINLQTREAQDGINGYTVQSALNDYADFLDKRGRKDEAKVLRDRANAIELAANKEGEELERKEREREHATRAKRTHHNKTTHATAFPTYPSPERG